MSCQKVHKSPLAPPAPWAAFARGSPIAGRRAPDDGEVDGSSILLERRRKGTRSNWTCQISRLSHGIQCGVWSIQQSVGRGSSWSCVLLRSGASKLFVSGTDAAVQLVSPPLKQVVWTNWPLNLSPSSHPKCAYTHHRDLGLVGDKSPWVAKDGHTLTSLTQWHSCVKLLAIFSQLDLLRASQESCINVSLQETNYSSWIAHWLQCQFQTRSTANSRSFNFSKDKMTPSCKACLSSRPQL